ncbi:MAG TPA: hypothetical protein VFS79_14855 [Arthrobacter sp.]|nr:hypothetical protein [Arthrobacter sp.]
MLADRLESLLDPAAQSPDAKVFVQENPTPLLTETWAFPDGVARTSGTRLPAGTAAAACSGYP